jgi:hypothetical protein
MTQDDAINIIEIESLNIKISQSKITKAVDVLSKMGSRPSRGGFKKSVARKVLSRRKAHGNYKLKKEHR